MIVRLCVPFVCLLTLSGCDNFSLDSTTQEEIAKSTFINKVKSNFVYINGGSFMMGDFGVEHYDEHLPLDAKKDSKPLHEVELSSYSISKYQVTNSKFQYYLKQAGKKNRQDSVMQSEWDSLNKIPNMPAHADWYEANGYCEWLAGVSKLPISLATEAQWEYAARSKGKYLVVPTDDGKWHVNGEKNNVATSKDRDVWAKKNNMAIGSLSALPVGSYPANQVGLYDMGTNGFEWVKDWYDPNYYQHSAKNDPQGPENPTWKNYDGKHTKVMRGDEISGPGRGVVVVRTNMSPDNDGDLPLAMTFRCVVNSSSPIN